MTVCGLLPTEISRIRIKSRDSALFFYGKIHTREIRYTVFIYGVGKNPFLFSKYMLKETNS